METVANGCVRYAIVGWKKTSWTISDTDCFERRSLYNLQLKTFWWQRLLIQTFNSNLISNFWYFKIYKIFKFKTNSKIGLYTNKMECIEHLQRNKVLLDLSLCSRRSFLESESTTKSSHHTNTSADFSLHIRNPWRAHFRYKTIDCLFSAVLLPTTIKNGTNYGQSLIEWHFSLPIRHLYLFYTDNHFSSPVLIPKRLAIKHERFCLPFRALTREIW